MSLCKRGSRCIADKVTTPTGGTSIKDWLHLTFISVIDTAFSIPCRRSYSMSKTSLGSRPCHRTTRTNTSTTSYHCLLPSGSSGPKRFFYKCRFYFLMGLCLPVCTPDGDSLVGEKALQKVSFCYWCCCSCFVSVFK